MRIFRDKKMNDGSCLDLFFGNWRNDEDGRRETEVYVMSFEVFKTSKDLWKKVSIKTRT
jgi:hypothetical protein